eukprot:gene5223-biopygen8676
MAGCAAEGACPTTETAATISTCRVRTPIGRFTLRERAVHDHHVGVRGGVRGQPCLSRNLGPRRRSPPPPDLRGLSGPGDLREATPCVLLAVLPVQPVLLVLCQSPTAGSLMKTKRRRRCPIKKNGILKHTTKERTGRRRHRQSRKDSRNEGNAAPRALPVHPGSE